MTFKLQICSHDTVCQLYKSLQTTSHVARRLAIHSCCTSTQIKLYVALPCRAGTIALAGNLGGLQISNTGTGTIYTSGVSAASAAAISGSGRTVVLPSSGKALCVHEARQSFA